MNPNPIKAREYIQELNDGWLFGFDKITWREIRVPFCPESKLSGIGHKDFIYACYYKKRFTADYKAERVFINFGAVDYHAVLYVNGKYAGRHTGGYTPFAFDITELLTCGENELLLEVRDNEKTPHAFGKQSYKKDSFGCFYTRVTGIWQPVWLEFLPANHIKDFRFYPDPETAKVGVELETSGKGGYRVTVFYNKRKVGEARGDLAYKTRFEIGLSEKRLWEVGNGELYDVTIEYENDRILSYFGLRSVKYDGYRFMLNGRSVFQKFVLDQGYHPDGIYTMPDIGSMQRDIDKAAALGFNGARLHQKVFDPRFLYLCDKAGFMVWGEYPNWGIDYSDSDNLGQFFAEWQETLKRDFNHPSVVTWCPLNEVWGAWDDPAKLPDIRFVEQVYDFTKRFDCTRPCVDASGGFHGGRTDLFDFHCYEPVEKLKEYIAKLSESDVLEVPLLYADENSVRYKKGQPVNISEYGGIAFGTATAEKSRIDTVNEGAVQSTEAWGYGKGESTTRAFIDRFRAVTELIFSCKKISGYCYTQLYDVEQEQNGFYKYDRTCKLTRDEIEEIRRIQSQRTE